MAELTTDAQALSEAATSFDGITHFFLFEDRSSEAGAGMQDTEKGVTGMFAMAGDTGGETVQKLASIWGGSGSESYQGVQQRWDSTSEAATSFDRISGDLKGAIGQVDSTAGDLAGALSGPAGNACAAVGDMDSFVFEDGASEPSRSGTQYQSAADDAASSLTSSMGFSPPDDDFGLKAMEPGGGIPATMAEWALLLA